MASTFKIPHTFTIVFCIVIACAILTWIVPGGEFVRDDAGNVIADSYHRVDSQPQTWQIFTAFYAGFQKAANIIVFILMIGGAFWVLNTTNAINVGIYSFLGFTEKLQHNKVMKAIGVNNLVIILIMLMFSAALAFTDVYDGDFMRYFITVYNFAVLGVLVLSQTMSYEGNYLDGLMSRKESILNRLRAKYYVQCALLFIPLIIMILPITEGKISLLSALACFFLTSGFTFWTLMQLAVYNKLTINLNTKVTGKNTGGTFFQSMIIMAGFFLPVIIIQVFTSLLSENTALLIILGIGIAFTLTHPLWLRNIYKRFMKRRYENMEGFRSSVANN